MGDIQNLRQEIIAGTLLACVLCVIALLCFAPEKGRANGEGPAGDTIPAQLRIHYEATNTGSLASKSEKIENTTTWTLDMTAVFEVPRMDYHARDSQGRDVQYSFGYGEQLSGSTPFKLTSLSGQATYFHQESSTSTQGVSTMNEGGTEKGSAQLGPGQGSFEIWIVGDKILVGANSGLFPTTGMVNNSSSGHGNQTSSWSQKGNLSVDTPRYPWNGDGAGPEWTVNTRWTGTGWAGTVQEHTQSSSDVSGEKKAHENLATMTFSLELSGKEPVEAVIVPPTTYSKWLPEAGNDEDTAGNWLTVKVVLQQKGKPGKKPGQRTAKFKIELTNVSQEPGVCLNWPPFEQVKRPPGFDLQIKPNKNPEITLLKGTIADDGQSAETSKGLQEISITISSFDWGAYGKIKVTAILDDDGSPVIAHLQDKPGVESLTLPKDDNDNHIADAWEDSLYMVSNDRSAEADEDSIPDGDGTPGDGLSFYEEYRGFMVQGKHIRTDPDFKDIFIVDQDHLGLGFFSESHLRTHVVSYQEVDFAPGDERNPWVINFNYGYGHLGVQHALWLKNQNLPGLLGIAEGNGPGPPKKTFLVEVDRAKCLKDGPDELASIIAHELAHASNLYHHGDSDYQGTLAEERTNRGTKKYNQKIWTISVKGGQESGVEKCIMRYDGASFVEHPPDPPANYNWKWKKVPVRNGVSPTSGFIEGESYGYAEPPGTIFCSKPDDDEYGVNAADHQPWPKAGDADRGNCQKQFCVNDVSDCKYKGKGHP